MKTGYPVAGIVGSPFSCNLQIMFGCCFNIFTFVSSWIAHRSNLPNINWCIELYCSNRTSNFMQVGKSYNSINCAKSVWCDICLYFPNLTISGMYVLPNAIYYSTYILYILIEYPLNIYYQKITFSKYLVLLAYWVLLSFFWLYFHQASKRYGIV